MKSPKRQAKSDRRPRREIPPRVVTLPEPDPANRAMAVLRKLIDRARAHVAGKSNGNGGPRR